MRLVLEFPFLVVIRRRSALACSVLPPRCRFPSALGIATPVAIFPLSFSSILFWISRLLGTRVINHHSMSSSIQKLRRVHMIHIEQTLNPRKKKTRVEKRREEKRERNKSVKIVSVHEREAQQQEAGTRTSGVTVNAPLVPLQVIKPVERPSTHTARKSFRLLSVRVVWAYCPPMSRRLLSPSVRAPAQDRIRVTCFLAGGNFAPNWHRWSGRRRRGS